jgi:hypothetical protein
MLKNRQGFTSVELILFVLLIIIITSIGFFVLSVKNYSNKTIAKTDSSQASKPAQLESKLKNLNEAVAQAQSTYDSYVEYNADPDPKSKAGVEKLPGYQANKPGRSQDLLFMYKHSEKFANKFVKAAEKQPDPVGGQFLICESGSSFLRSVKVTGNSLTGNEAKLAATQTYGYDNSRLTFRLTARFSNDKWLISEVDLYDCPKS